MCNLSDKPASNSHMHEDRLSSEGNSADLSQVSGKNFGSVCDIKPQRVRQPVRQRIREGSLCPYCKTHRLEYDGQINLSCPQCGVISGGCFT